MIGPKSYTAQFVPDTTFQLCINYMLIGSQGVFWDTHLSQFGPCLTTVSGIVFLHVHVVDSLHALWKTAYTHVHVTKA